MHVARLVGAFRIGNEFKTLWNQRRRLQNSTSSLLKRQDSTLRHNSPCLSRFFSTEEPAPKERSTSKNTKGEKMFKPSVRGSPKHAFAREYIEKHGAVSQAHMKELWTSLPPEQRQVYKVRARQDGNDKRRKEHEKKRKQKRKGQEWIAPKD